MTGDYILVNKFKFGSRLPFTPLALPFFHQYLPFTENTKSFLDWIELPYFRIFGGINIKRNDVVVFNYPLDDDFPIDQRTYFIKRCVAFPGDTLAVLKGQVFINGQYADDTSKLQFNYKLICNTDIISQDTLSALEITEGGRMSNKGEFWFTLDDKSKEKLALQKNILSIEKQCNLKETYNDFLFPENEKFLWNLDFYGPLVIPKQGDSVRLTIDSLAMYKRIIVNYEKNDLFIRNDSIFINKKFATFYTFKMNYYFMMGDNRHNSTDSRFWGFVPENHLVGKASFVFLSIDKTNGKSKLRWNRFFKSIE